MNKFQNLAIEPIYDPYDLSLTVKFLRIKFLSSYKWAYELFNHVLLMNKKYDLYGFKLMQGKKLRGAILSIYQGKYSDDANKVFDVINTVCWCVDKELKGLPALMLLKHQADFHKDSIITSYTIGNLEALNIHYKLGYKNMSTQFTRYYPINPTILMLDNLKIFQIQANEIPLEKNFIIKIEDQKDLEYFKFEIKKNKHIYFIGIKKIKFLKKIPIPHFLVLWTSDDFSFLLYKDQIWKYFFKRNNCFFLDFYQKSLTHDIESNTYRKKFLIKSPCNINFYPPLGGELSIKEIMH